MSSLKKRAIWGMVIGVVCLAAGIALLYFGRDSLDHALKTGFADSGKSSSEDIGVRIAIGSLPFIGGGGLTVLGFFLFPLSLCMWIRDPQPGSKLTFRGWKAPDQMTESDVAQDKAWTAILWGYLATQSWVMQICFGGYRALLLHTSFAMKILMFLLITCTVLYTLGIRHCRRRDPSSVAAAPGLGSGHWLSTTAV